MDYETAVRNMLDWAEGRRSNWNEFRMCYQGEPENQHKGAIAAAECARADAAEVEKWAAVARVFRDTASDATLLKARRLFVEWQKGPAMMTTANFADRMQRILGTESPWEEAAHA